MEQVSYYDTTLDNLPIDTGELYRLMGYGDHTPPEEIIAMIDEVTGMLRSHCRPRYGYALFPGRAVDKRRIEAGGTIFNTGAIITHAMKEATQIALFTATAGMEFHNRLQELKREDNILLEFIADALGSVIAEGAAQLLNEHLSREAAKAGLKISNNYSPGYCDWSLQEQKKLFALLPEGITGITLTASSLMIPVKSVSGIIAVGSDVKRRPYGCDICTMKDCASNLRNRRHKLTGHP